MQKNKTKAKFSVIAFVGAPYTWDEWYTKFDITLIDFKSRISRGADWIYIARNIEDAKKQANDFFYFEPGRSFKWDRGSFSSHPEEFEMDVIILGEFIHTRFGTFSYKTTPSQ